MAELLEETSALESTTVYLWRNAKVVKGGRRFSLSALVVVGDRRGSVGIGYGKATGAPAAIEKAQKNARKNLTRVTLKGGTIPHRVNGRFCASKVTLIPAAPGTGVKAGATVRAVLEMAGVQDCLTRAYGSTNQKNLVKATIAGLQLLQTRESLAALRGVEVETSHAEELIEAGVRYMPKSTGEKARAPVNKVGQKTGGRGRGPGGRRGGGRDRGGDAGTASHPASEQTSGQQAAPAQPATPGPDTAGTGQQQS